MNRFGDLLGVGLWCCACAAWAEDRSIGTAQQAPVAADVKSCTQLIQVVVARLELKGQPDSYHDCRRWPVNEAYSLVAAAGACRQGKLDPSAECDLGIALVESKSGRILKSLYEPGAIISDALQFSRLRLDVAPYRLAPGVRAFGVRFLGEGVTSLSSETLNLYVEQGNGFREVLHDLTVTSNAWGAEEITTVAIGNTVHHGLADLRVTTVSNEPRGAARKTRRVTAYTYDGRSYMERMPPSPAAAGSSGGSK